MAEFAFSFHFHQNHHFHHIQNKLSLLLNPVGFPAGAFKTRIDAEVLFRETPYLNRAEKRGFIRETSRPTVSADTIVAIPNPTTR